MLVNVPILYEFYRLHLTCTLLIVLSTSNKVTKWQGFSWFDLRPCLLTFRVCEFMLKYTLTRQHNYPKERCLPIEFGRHTPNWSALTTSCVGQPSSGLGITGDTLRGTVAIRRHARRYNGCNRRGTAWSCGILPLLRRAGPQGRSVEHWCHLILAGTWQFSVLKSCHSSRWTGWQMNTPT